MNLFQEQRSKTLVSELHALHNEAVIISKNLAKDEFLLIEILQKVDERKVYRFMGFKSLFQYATIALKLDDNRAYTFIQVSRSAARHLKLNIALRNGLSLSRAKRITSVITKENEDHWVSLAEKLPQRFLERAVCKVNPKSAVEEGTRFVSENTLELRAAISVDTEILLKRVQDVLSQSRGKAVSFDEALKAMANTFLDKKDPLRKAQRVQSLKLKKTMMQDQATQRKTQEGQEIHQGQEIKEVERIQQNETTQKSQEIQQTQRPQSLQCQENLKPTTALQNSAQDVRLRKPIPSQLKRQVYLRDEGKCQKDNCGDSRWVDVHHIHPVMEEGENILENLITLCRGHHQLEHSHDTHL